MVQFNGRRFWRWRRWRSIWYQRIANIPLQTLISENSIELFITISKYPFKFTYLHNFNIVLASISIEYSIWCRFSVAVMESISQSGSDLILNIFSWDGSFGLFSCEFSCFTLTPSLFEGEKCPEDKVLFSERDGFIFCMITLKSLINVYSSARKLIQLYWMLQSRFSCGIKITNMLKSAHVKLTCGALSFYNNKEEKCRQLKNIRKFISYK